MRAAAFLTVMIIGLTVADWAVKMKPSLQGVPAKLVGITDAGNVTDFGVRDQWTLVSAMNSTRVVALEGFLQKKMHHLDIKKGQILKTVDVDKTVLGWSIRFTMTDWCADPLSNNLYAFGQSGFDQMHVIRIDADTGVATKACDMKSKVEPGFATKCAYRDGKMVIYSPRTFDTSFDGDLIAVDVTTGEVSTWFQVPKTSFGSKFAVVTGPNGFYAVRDDFFTLAVHFLTDGALKSLYQTDRLVIYTGLVYNQRTATFDNWGGSTIEQYAVGSGSKVAERKFPLNDVLGDLYGGGTARYNEWVWVQ